MPVPMPKSARAGRRFVPEFSPLEGRALLSTFTVRNLNDSGPGSLRDALAKANVTPGADVVVFAPRLAGTIGLGSPLDVSSDVTIQGPGASLLALDGQGQTQDLRVDAGVSATITELTITGGQGDSEGLAQGSGIHNDGTLSLDRVVVRNNAAGQTWGGALGGYGGGIDNTAGAHLTLTRSVVANNSVVATNGFEGGGGIYNAGTLTVSSTTFSGNSIVGFGIANILNGGAVFNGTATATATIDLGTFTANGSNSVESLGRLTLERSTVSGDRLVGVASLGTTTIDSCTVSGNGTKWFTSAGVQARGQLTLINSTVANNAGPGLIVLRGWGARVTIVSIASSTIAGNTDFLDTSPNATLVAGAGIDVQGLGNSPTIVLHDTIVAGNVVAPLSGGSPIGRDLNTSTASSLLVKPPKYESLGYNLIQNPGTVTFTGTTTGNLYGFDPKLGPLANNGGPTWTMALLPDSPAIDAGDPDPAGLPAHDQRGLPRVAGGRADIGAYEVQ